VLRPFDEPVALRHETLCFLNADQEAGLARIAAGHWIATPLWRRWGRVLRPLGMDREQFGRIVAGYQNELRLWVIGERTWAQCQAGLIGRVVRRTVIEIQRDRV
jgi:hypothetical protein